MESQKYNNGFWRYVQLACAMILCLSGLTLIYIGFYAPPIGEIHHTVLVAYGEVCTFSGALFGVDYHYRYKHDHNHERKDN